MTVPGSENRAAADGGAGAEIIIRPAEATELDLVRALFRAYAHEIAIDLCFQGFEEELANLPGKYAPPSGALFLAEVVGSPAVAATDSIGPARQSREFGGLSRAHDGLSADAAGRVVGCVAVRTLAPGECEMKRLYVKPAARAARVGWRLAVAAIAAGRAAGYQRMRLDTLATMTAAMTLYRRLGFEETPAYYVNPHATARFFALSLA